MTTDQNRIVTLVVRYGLPVLVLVFYLSAVRHFDYTPDSTYATAQVVHGVGTLGAFAGPAGLVETTSPSPLWVMFQMAGLRAAIEVVFFAKVFGLFFCCAVLILGYLTAFEVTDDRLLAFCSAFVLATGAWFSYLAPTGSALPAAMALTLACFFFLLRNEYILASLFSGLTAMILWEGAALFVLVIADLLLNSVIRDRAYRMAGVCALVFAVVVVPWVLFARLHGFPMVPGLVPLGDVPEFGALWFVSWVLLVVLALCGVGLTLRGSNGWIHVRTHAALITWTAVMLAAGVAGSWEHYVLGAPFLIIGAFVGIQRGLRAVGRSQAIYLSAFGLAAAMLLMNQITYLGKVRPAMQELVESSRDLEAVAAWLKINAADLVRVAAEHPGELGYRSGRAVEPLGEGGPLASDLIITSKKEVAGYTQLLVVSLDSIGIQAASGSRLSIWKKHQ